MTEKDGHVPIHLNRLYLVVVVTFEVVSNIQMLAHLLGLTFVSEYTFLSCLYECRGSNNCNPEVGIGMCLNVGVTLQSFTTKFFL